jgi:hypothetical protein
METLTNGLTPSSAEYIWGTNVVSTNLQSNTFQYNTGSWVKGLKGLSSCCAGWVTYTTNGSTVTTNININNDQIHNMTLITPQHALIAYHTASMFGQTYMFVGTNNVEYFATVDGISEVETTNYYGGLTTIGLSGLANDIAVVEFKTNVDAHVQPASILSQTAIRELPNVGWFPIDFGYTNTCLAGVLPCIACNQYKQAYATDLNYVNLPSGSEPQMFFNTNSLWFPNWANSIVDFDSGSPIYVLIQNELVLMGAWHGYDGIGAGPPYPEAPWCGYDVKALNTTISTLCSELGTTNYQVTTKNLSAFPDL